MLMRTIDDEKLAQVAYLFGCQRTGEAIVIDPERDVGRYIEITRSPEILMSQDADIGAGRARLRDSFDGSAPELNKETGK